MSTPVIIDGVLALGLLVFALVGFRQGGIKTLAGLIITVVSLVGAAIVAGSFSEPATNLVAPMISKTVERRVDDALIAHTGSFDTDLLEGTAEEILAMVGIDADAREGIAQRAEEVIQETGSTVVSAVVVGITRSIIYVLLFLAAFLALELLLHVLAGAMELVAHLPVLSATNALMGALLGVLKGGLLVFLAIWVARRCGISLETETVAQTQLLKFFADNTPLSVLSLLR